MIVPLAHGSYLVSPTVSIANRIDINVRLIGIIYIYIYVPVNYTDNLSMIKHHTYNKLMASDICRFNKT